jgi:hypothetical protein
MTLREAITKFKERYENNPKFQEIREKLKKMAEEKASKEEQTTLE